MYMSRNSKRNAAAAITQGQAVRPDDPFDNLAIAIVEFAANDYRAYSKRKKRLMKRDMRYGLSQVEAQLKQLEQFFQSDWCFALSGGTNIAILERLQKEQEV